MSKKSAVLLPKTQKILEQMGEQIKYDRLRRYKRKGALI